MGESRQRKLELIDQALRKILADNNSDEDASANSLLFLSDNEAENHHLLSRLLSELESLKGDGKLKEPEDSAEYEAANSMAVGEKAESDKKQKVEEVDGGGNTEIGAEEVVKELRKVKRQNIITHCLISAMIVLTVAWQLSEVSMILKVREGLSHPFRSAGSLLFGMLKGPPGDSSNKEQQSEASPTTPLMLPELPRLDLGLNDDDDDD